MAKMDRRDFLKAGAAGAFAASFPVPLRCLGTTKQSQDPGPVFVAIYLRGGMDPLNVVVPHGFAEYYKIRPTIAIRKEPGEGAKGVIDLDGKFGLHPALAPLVSLWKAKMFAPIVNVGSPHPTRSHFDAQDFMEYAAPGLRTVHQGWLNRYLAATADRNGKDSELRALATQGLLPRSMRGTYPVLAVQPERRRDRTGELLDLFDELYGKDDKKKVAEPPKQMKGRRRRKRMERREDPVLASGQATIRSLRRYRQIQAGDFGMPRGYPRGGLAAKLKGIASVIKSGERIHVAGADWNGWDHHTGEGAEDGRMAKMLGHLGAAIAAFYQDLGAHGKRTVVLTMSEFGRTCRENGNAGTDHGHGGLMLAFGGKVRGGTVHGRFDGLENGHLYQGRDLPVTTDFRDVFCEVLTRHMGFEPPHGFFPDYRPRKDVGVFA